MGNVTELSRNSIVLLVALFATAFHHLLVEIPVNVQWAFLCIALLVTGIPHGALDHLVAQKNCDIAAKKFSSRSFYIRYLSRIVAFGILWLLFPMVALVIFLMISAFHFGETDLPIEGTHSKIPALAFQTSYGAFLLIALLSSHLTEIEPLLAILTRSSVAMTTVISKSFIIAAVVASFTMMMITATWYMIKYAPPAYWTRKICIQTLAILVIVVFLPLPLAFAFYFGCWHSINALGSIRDHLSTSVGVKITWSWMFRQVLPFTLLALAGIIISYVLLNSIRDVYMPLQAFIIGIAVLTAPHLEVMSEMYDLIRNRHQPLLNASDVPSHPARS